MRPTWADHARAGGRAGGRSKRKILRGERARRASERGPGMAGEAFPARKLSLAPFESRRHVMGGRAERRGAPGPLKGSVGLRSSHAGGRHRREPSRRGRGARGRDGLHACSLHSIGGRTKRLPPHLSPSVGFFFATAGESKRESEQEAREAKKKAERARLARRLPLQPAARERERVERIILRADEERASRSRSRSGRKQGRARELSLALRSPRESKREKERGARARLLAVHDLDPACGMPAGRQQPLK